jgi:glycine/D-amino acid oxidase-like deaminating enzyme
MITKRERLVLKVTEQSTGSKNTPLWTAENRVPAIYPWLYREETCNVCIVGGGITGALCALRFAQAGVSTVLLAGGPAGYGGTSRSSGVMQCDAAGGLLGLSKKIGVEDAVRVYAQCALSLDEMEKLAASFEEDCGFARRDVFSYTDQEQNADILHEEYLLKRHNGADVEMYSRDKARDHFSFDVVFGILTRNMAATVDPYLLTHRVLTVAEQAGAHVYEHSPVENISHDGGVHILTTGTRHSVCADTVVVAIGHECCDFLKGAGSRRTCFMAATEPVPLMAGWQENCVINHVDKPAVTFSVTPQGRILAAGLEAGLVGRTRVAGILPLEALAAKKYAQLEADTQRMFTGIRSLSSQYVYTGEYIQTEDSLPLIGRHPDYPGCFFALCTAQNGALYSEMASRLLLHLYQGEPDEMEELFTPERLL